MNLRDFEYLIAVNELKSFVGAAKKCHVSQPALSQQVRKVEDVLGVQIFERYKNEIITTLKGKEVIEHARKILEIYSSMGNVSDNVKKITIAFIPTICSYLLPKIIKELNKAFEKEEVRFYFVEEKTDDLLAKLKKGEIDVGIIAHFEHLVTPAYEYQKLYDEEFLLTLPKTSKFKEEDFPKLVESRELILLEEGNCMSDNIRHICKLYQNSSFNEFYATNIETLKNMVKIGNGVALLPELCCEDEKDLKFVSFKEKKTREVGMIWRKGDAENKEIFEKISGLISVQIERYL